MAPIHLIHWGNPKVEQGEIEALISIWSITGNPGAVEAHAVVDMAPEALRDAIQLSLSDVAVQMIYVSCHGNEDLLAYDTRCTSTVSKSKFAEWLHQMEPAQEMLFPGDVDPHFVWIVFGCCESMSGPTNFETILPSWVEKVYGFTGSPNWSDVVDLQAGVADDLWQNGNRASDAIIAASDKTMGQGIDERFAAMQAALDATPIEENPGQHLDRRGMSSGVAAIMAVRNANDGWDRTTL